jgi:ABC-type transporter Mla MlaB component
MESKTLDVHMADEQPGSLALLLAGPLTESASAALPERMCKLLEGRPQTEVVVSLEACEAVDSSGLGALVSFRLQPHMLAREVILRVGKPGPVHEALQLLQLGRLFSLEEVAADGSRTLTRCAAIATPD